MARDELRPDIQAASDKIRGKLGAGREIRKLVEYLGDGETVDLLAPGRFANGQGLLVLTDRRLLFIRDGITSHASEDFPFPQINSVAWASGMLLGKVTIVSAGIKVEIANVDKSVGKLIVDNARDRIAARAGAPAAAQLAPAAASASDELTRLAGLHASGVLTDDEFTAAKAKALGL